MYDRVYIYEFEGNLSSQIHLLKSDEDYLGFWREADYSFLFFRKSKEELLRKLFPPYRSAIDIRHEDWESAHTLDVLRVGRFLLHPPWKPPPADDGISICIDPGMAFGSGYHASTRGCLTLLDRLFQEYAPERVLDLGTGTGILSIACLKTGARSAFALDYNNLAVETARKNRGLNGLQQTMHLWMGEAGDFLHVPAGLLLANLHFQALDRLTDREAFFSREYVLLSGMLGLEGHRIEEKLKGRLVLLDTVQENFWFTHLFRA